MHGRALAEAELRYFDLGDDVSDEEKTARFLFKQVTEGIQYLHTEALVAHRDIKPDNIFYNGEEDLERVKIGDYTLAVEMPSPDFKVTGRAGSLAFMPPECFKEEAYDPRLMDMWALGVSIYIYVTLELPFKGDSE